MKMAMKNEKEKQKKTNKGNNGRILKRNRKRGKKTFQSEQCNQLKTHTIVMGWPSSVVLENASGETEGTLAISEI